MSDVCYCGQSDCPNTSPVSSPESCADARERALRARVAELEDDFAKRQASHCCPTWNDQMEDCDCDERMGGHIARWQEAEAEVARLRKEQAESEHDEQQWNDMLRAESDALAKGSDAWLRHVLGHDWNKLWGPNLEALGRGVDELRAEVARLRESEARMRAALEHLVDMRERDVRELGDVDWDLIEAAFDAGTAPAPSPCVECGSPIAPGNKLLCASCCNPQLTAPAPLSERERATKEALELALAELDVTPLDHDKETQLRVTARWHLMERLRAALAPYAEVE